MQNLGAHSCERVAQVVVSRELRPALRQVQRAVEPESSRFGFSCSEMRSRGVGMLRAV